MSDTSTVFTLMADVHRRRVLFALHEAESVAVPDALAADGGAVAGGDGPLRLPGADRRNAVRLRHTHLPKLEEAGVVEWDRDAGRVSRGPEFGTVEPLLDLLVDNADDLPVDVP